MRITKEHDETEALSAERSGEAKADTRPEPAQSASTSPPQNQFRPEEHVEVRLVSVEEMARILGVPVGWIYQRTRLGPDVIPFIKIGKYVRFEPEKVIAHYRERQLQEWPVRV